MNIAGQDTTYLHHAPFLASGRVRVSLLWVSLTNLLLRSGPGWTLRYPSPLHPSLLSSKDGLH